MYACDHVRAWGPKRPEQGMGLLELEEVMVLSCSLDARTLQEQPVLSAAEPSHRRAGSAGLL